MMAALQCRLLGTEGFMNNVISVVMYCISSDVSVINYDNIIKPVCFPLSLWAFLSFMSLSLTKLCSYLLFLYYSYCLKKNHMFR